MSKMTKNREGFLVSKTKRECTNCGTIFKITSKTVTLCNSCNSTRVKKESAEIRMWRRAKSRSKIRGISFTIDVNDIIIPTTCPILNIPLFCTIGKSGSFDNSPSLDRIDPQKGYVKGNIMVISSLANVMKNNATPEILITFAEWIFKNYSKTA